MHDLGVVIILFFNKKTIKKQGTDQKLVAPCITPKNQMKTSYVKRPKASTFNFKGTDKKCCNTFPFR